MNNRIFHAAIALLTTTTLLACAPVASTEPSTATANLETYTSPHPNGNSFACAHCHALEEPANDGVRRAGHTLAGATQRTSFKNGQLTSLRDAIDSCLEEWMVVPDSAREDPTFMEELIAVLQEREADDVDTKPIIFTIAAPPGNLQAGSADAGQALFNSSCVMCHGKNAIGTLQGPALRGDTLTPAEIAKRIRTSGRSDSSVYGDLTGGVMPFWSAERLSDNEVRDLVSYVMTTEAQATQSPDDTDSDTGNGSDNDGTSNGGTSSGNIRACSSTHALVGATGSLSTVAHGVSGDVTVVDDCTIQIKNFNFDGGGIVVQVYGAKGGAYSSGFGIGPDIKGTAYSGETLTVQLSESQSLDDLDGISIWCVTARVDFGSTSLD